MRHSSHQPQPHLSHSFCRPLYARYAPVACSEPPYLFPGRKDKEYRLKPSQTPINFTRRNGKVSFATSKRNHHSILQPTAEYHAVVVYFLRRSKDTETDVLSGNTNSAICVQKSDDSLKSAIHNAYRISLRPSSMREPRHPLLKVF